MKLKMFLFIAMSYASLALFSGCGGNTEPDNTAEPKPKKEFSASTKEQAEQLIKKLGGVNGRDDKGRTPLHIAVSENGKEVLTVIEFLLDQGADINAKDTEGQTPLHDAVKDGKIEIARLLITNGAKINTRNKPGGFPLLCSIGTGKPELVKLLVENGADVNMKSNCGEETALDFATNSKGPGMDEIVKYLKEHGAKHGKQQSPPDEHPAPPVTP